jgi:hypothetical protein
VSVDPTGLAVGPYVGSITLAATGASNSPQTIPVTLNVGSTVLTVSPASLSFTYALGATVPPSQNLTLTSSASALNYTTAVTTSSGCNWLSLINGNGITPATPPSSPAVAVDPTGLAKGLYTCTITVTAQGASNSPVVVPVQLTVTDKNVITVSPTSLNFSCQVGATPPPTQYLTLTSSGTPLQFTAAPAAGSAWLQVSNGTGTTPVSGSAGPADGVKCASLTPGFYVGTLIVTAPDAINSPGTIPVTLVVTSVLTSSSTLPVGQTGIAYTASLTASGGVPPYTWTPPSPTGAPAGLTVDPSGKVSWLNLKCGIYNFTVTLTDSAKTSILVPLKLVIAPTINFGGISNTPFTQLPIGLSLTSSCPVAISGQLSLTFVPNPLNPGDDKTIGLSTGSAASFNIAANAATATFAGSATTVGLQTGTVAGTITIGATLSGGQTDLTPPSGSATLITINRLVPAITSVTASRSSLTLTVTVQGYSTTRELISATFTFNGANIQSPPVSVDLRSLSNGWFVNQASTAANTGGQFSYVQQFAVTGDATKVTSVSVTLTNSIGTSSPPKSASF